MQDLINTKILQDILVENELSTEQRRELLKTIERLNYQQPVINIGTKKVISLIFANNGVLGYEVPYGITLEQAEDIAKKKKYRFDEFDIDTYEVNNYGGMSQIDRKRYNKSELNEISASLLREFNSR